MTCFFVAGIARLSKEDEFQTIFVISSTTNSTYDQEAKADDKKDDKEKHTIKITLQTFIGSTCRRRGSLRWWREIEQMA